MAEKAFLLRHNCKEGFSQKEYIVSIPAINEHKTIEKTILKIREQLGESAYIIVCVAHNDDPSIEKAMADADAILVQPRRGYGLAHRTSIYYGLTTLPRSNIRTVIMSDADGTYDLDRLAEMNSLAQQNRLVIGTRFANGRPKDSMPMVNYIGNKIISTTFRMLYGKKIEDTQSGLKLFPASLAYALTSDGMEFSSECILDSMRWGLPIQEVPILYHRRMGVSKLHVFADFLRIMSFVIINKFVGDGNTIQPINIVNSYS